MLQAIHIFLKDARHWRWLIVLQLALLATRTAMAPGYADFRSGWQQAPDTLDMLLPLVWWFLIAVVIYDENLDVGREFWITRPYSWQSLLAAKVLFVAVFVLAPLLIGDIVTLALAHFQVGALLPHLLWFECLKLLILLPAALLASVTSGIRQFLAGSLLLIFIMYATALLAMRSAFEDAATLWFTLALIAIPAALIVWQYAQRRTWLVRSIAAAAYMASLIPNASSVSVIGTPHPEIAIQFAPDIRRDPPFGSGHRQHGVELAIPIAITGRYRNLVEPSLINARIQSGGFEWQANRDWYNNLTVTGSDWLRLAIPKADFDRLKQTRAIVQAEVAINVYEVESQTTLPAGGPWLSLGAAGQARLRWKGRFLGAERRMALFDPGYKLVYGLPTPIRREWGTISEATSVGIYPRDLAEVHMSSVFFYTTGLGSEQFGYINLLVERPVARIKWTLTIRDVRLDDWVIGR
jgi:hypothetical protein